MVKEHNSKTPWFVEIDKHLSQYILAFDKSLLDIQNRIPNRAQREVLHSAWVTIAQNAIMFLGTYRKNLGHIQNTIMPTPIYELAFYDRIIMEASSDFKYIFPYKNLAKKFLFEFNDITNGNKDMISELSDMNYNANYRFKDSTMKRIELCYGENGVAHYNVLCWNNHFNYVGYVLAISGRLDTEVRSKGLLFILGALNTIYETLDEFDFIKYNDPVVSFYQKSQKFIKVVKTNLDNYANKMIGACHE